MADKKHPQHEQLVFFRREAEAYKLQSYQQADLLRDIVPPLAALGREACPDVLDAASELSRSVQRNSQDVDAIGEASCVFLRVYHLAKETGRLRPLSQAKGEPSGGEGLNASTRERLAELILALPLESSALQKASELSSRLRGKQVAVAELESILDDLARLLAQALLSSQTRDLQLQRLVAQMSGELSVVEGFLGALDRRDDDALAQAMEVQAEVGERSNEIAAAFEGSEDLVGIKTQVLERASSIRVRMDKFAAEASSQRAIAAKTSAQLATRLADMETELQSTREQLVEAQESAAHDFLTGLYNRQAFEGAVVAWLQEPESRARLFCIIWDIDHFKNINDTHGHIVGDGVLQAVAQLLGQSVESSDIAARLGGEEFITVVRHQDADAVMKWADGVRQAIAALEHDAEKAKVSVSISCGLAQYRRSDTLVSIMARADKALYKAKDLGRNRCQWAT